MSSVEGARIFLSGPMTGLPDLNRDAFAEAEAWCMAHGADFCFNPTTAWGHSDRPREWYVLRDLHRLTEPGDGAGPLFTLVVRLPGWERSDGAWRESTVADDCGIACVDFETLRLEVGA